MDKKTALEKLLATKMRYGASVETREINGLTFVLTCAACPEQYDVFDKDGNMVGYVRLRWGALTCECPDCGGDLVYETDIGGGWAGCFEDDSQRECILHDVADAILRGIKEENFEEVKCYCDFVEDATAYWIAGKHYRVVCRDDDMGGWRIKHEYGEGIVYDEDFDDYFEKVFDNDVN